jgi:simple sugar transport system ATP-binding protein
MSATPDAMPKGAAPEPVLALENVSKRFGGTVALDRLDWSVDPGEIHCLVGENGSGKSTLIKIVAGVHKPDAGARIRLGGATHASLTPHQAKALGVQVIYQDLSLFPNLTVAENIAIDQDIGAALKPVSRRAMRATADSVLTSLGEALPLQARVGDLSVAQRQIVAICRGLAVKARILFMDEPTASLTRHEVEMLLAVVRRLKALGVAVIFVSHRLEEVVEIAERVTVLRDGAKVGTFPAREIDDRRLSELMTGSAVEHRLVTRPIDDTKPVLEVRGATRAGEFDDVSLTLRRGEVLGLTGLLGAGRTELALALFGMTRLDAGKVLLEGKPLALRSNQDAIAAGIAYVSEDRLSLGLNLKQSIADNVSITVLDRLAGFLRLIAPERRAALALDWIDRLNVRAADASAPAQTLSGGNQQRIVLAKWLATRPKVLLLDSPTVGVDIRNKQGIYDIVRSLADEGVGILLISDEISEVYFNADRILHMRGGRIAEAFVPGAVTEDAVASAVYA